MSELVDEILTAPDQDARRVLNDAGDAALASLFQSRRSEVVDGVLRVLDQRLANRIFALLSMDILRGALDQASSASVAKVLTLIQRPTLVNLLSKANNELVEKLIASAPSGKIRMSIVKALPQQRQAQWKHAVRQQEAEVQRTRGVAIESQGSLLEERKRLLSEIDAAIQVKEQVLNSLEQEAKIKLGHHDRLLSQAQHRLASLEDMISKREVTVAEREKALVARLAEIEEENKRQVQEKIEAKVPEFVTAALKVLEDREKAYRAKAAQWTAHGTIVLLAAVLSTAGISVYGYWLTSSVNGLSWQALFFISFKGLVVLGVLGLWAKHAFTVSNSYMHEAIKRSDRAHAITFGKLYLEIYGNTVDRKELLDIFENWNITSESAFSRANPSGFEPGVIDKISDFIRLSERGR